MKIILLEVPLPAYDFPFCLSLCICLCLSICFSLRHGGRSWQPFGEGKNAHTNFRQACICYFHDKYVVFVRNFNFANLIQCNMQHTPYNDSLLAQETLLLSPKGTLLHQVFQKVRKSRQILISRQNSLFSA